MSARTDLYHAATLLATLANSGAPADEVLRAYEKIHIIDFLLEEVRIRCRELKPDDDVVGRTH